MALLLLIELYLTKPEYFGGTLDFILVIMFLVVFPVLAYPLQPLVPGYRKKGREGQRSLAILMANIGYCFGIAAAALTAETREIWIVYLTYFISGILIMLFNKVFGIRASGHACGVAGPVLASIYFMGPAALSSLIILAAVYWASLSMKRHSMSELLAGTAIPAFALLAASLMAAVIN